MFINRKKETDHKPRSSQEYRRMAREHEEALASFWRLFGKTGIFAVAAVTILVVIGVAWFASNKKVQVYGLIVQGEEGDFALAVRKGVAGQWDEMLAPLSSGEELEVNGVVYYTTEKAGDILWSLDEQSHWENRENIGKGIRPGSRGALTFFIYAKKTGTLTVPLQLVMEGRTMEKEAVTEEAERLINGHILFFAGYEESSTEESEAGGKKKAYKGWISPDGAPWTMDLSIEEGNPNGGTGILSHTEDGNLIWTGEVEKGELYPITLYWIWPEVLGEFLYKSVDFVGDKPVLFPEDTTEGEGGSSPSVIPESLFTKMCLAEEGKAGNSYFLWAKPSDTEEEKEKQRKRFLALVSVDSLKEMRKDGNTFSYRRICPYYDAADQYIGENVGYLYLRVMTEEQH